MKVLLVGAGTVGEAIAKVAANRPWLDQMIVTDYDADRARFVVDSTEHNGRYIARRIDASSADNIAQAARDYGVDLVMNAVDPQFVMPIFDGALAAGTNYMDMAVSPIASRRRGAFLEDGRQARRRAIRARHGMGGGVVGWRWSAWAWTQG